MALLQSFTPWMLLPEPTNETYPEPTMGNFEEYNGNKVYGDFKVTYEPLIPEGDMKNIRSDTFPMKYPTTVTEEKIFKNSDKYKHTAVENWVSMFKIEPVNGRIFIERKDLNGKKGLQLKKERISDFREDTYAYERDGYKYEIEQKYTWLKKSLMTRALDEMVSPDLHRYNNVEKLTYDAILMGGFPKDILTVHGWRLEKRTRVDQPQDVQVRTTLVCDGYIIDNETFKNRNTLHRMVYDSGAAADGNRQIVVHDNEGYLSIFKSNHQINVNVLLRPTKTLHKSYNVPVLGMRRRIVIRYDEVGGEEDSNEERIVLPTTYSNVNTASVYYYYNSNTKALPKKLDNNAIRIDFDEKDQTVKFQYENGPHRVAQRSAVMNRWDTFFGNDVKTIAEGIQKQFKPFLKLIDACSGYFKFRDELLGSIIEHRVSIYNILENLSTPCPVRVEKRKAPGQSSSSNDRSDDDESIESLFAWAESLKGSGPN